MRVYLKKNLPRTSRTTRTKKISNDESVASVWSVVVFFISK
jgi:hypothetical protein